MVRDAGTARGAGARLTGRTATRLTGLTLYSGVSVSGFSATWTAPPASRTPPAAVAASFASADLTDMAPISLFSGADFDLATAHWRFPIGYANCTLMRVCRGK